MTDLAGYRNTIAYLDAISRRRALTLTESVQLERAIRTEEAVGAVARRREERLSRQQIRGAPSTVQEWGEG